MKTEHLCPYHEPGDPAAVIEKGKPVVALYYGHFPTDPTFDGIFVDDTEQPPRYAHPECVFGAHHAEPRQG